MEQLYEDNWVLLTTREGSRGSDFKGKSPAHVILTYQPESLAECVQALGRGTRNLDYVCSGAIMCPQPYTTFH